MDIHEYQAKDILARFGVRVPRGGLAYTPEQAAYRAQEIGGSRWVVKGQVHSGGRNQAGAIRVCEDEDEVYAAAEALLGKKIVTAQTGSEGKMVYRLFVESYVAFARELYLGLVLDRKSERIMLLASGSGGIEIEQIAQECPDTLIRSLVEPAVGMSAFQAREIAFGLNIPPTLISEAVDTLLGCYRAFEEFDATMVEINPWVISEDNQIYALDAKMTFDDNALFRHPEIAELRDKSQEDPRETKATDRGLNYVRLQGNIGCVSNGAGLAMATMEMIQQFGGSMANFVDVGGGAPMERVAKAIRLVRADPQVESLIINIFGGINRCDWVAEGVVQALQRDPVDIPIVLRLAGTHLEQGRKIISKSGLPIIRAKSLEEAAQRVCKTVAASSS